MTTQRCTSCQAEVSGEAWRLLPIASDGTLVDGTFCEPCWPAALEAIRTNLTAADPEAFEDVMQAALIRAYLEGRGVKVRPATNLDRDALVGDAGRLLDQIQARDGFWGRRVMCSGCYETPRELDVTTIPWWNDSLDDYVTTYRCQGCLAAGLADTRARLAQNAADDVARVCALFERHAVFVHEQRRGDPLDVVRPIVERAEVIAAAPSRSAPSASAHIDGGCLSARPPLAPR